MTEEQTQDLINVLGELTEAISSLDSKGQHGYTIADSLEELALQYWHKQDETAPRVQAQIDAINKMDKEAIADGWDNIPLDSIKK
jgi:hypothetical protein